MGACRMPHRPKKQLKLMRSSASGMAAAPLRKRVRFQEGPPALFPYGTYFGDECEGDSDADVHIEENVPTARKTDEMTVLSTEHGRARRKLRDISKHDLQTCIKYGIKSPGHRHPKTGEARWLYFFDGVTYVTNSTSRVEVTCYKEPIRIERAVITEDMLRRHNEQVTAIRDDPMLCASHAIIIDQSGSMKTADFMNFRSRSHAAYGILALEYIAEQLHGRADDDNTIDAVSIIEMHDHGSMFLQEEPMDWILFNRLLDRQAAAQSKSHGNYNTALDLAEMFISQKIQQSDEMPLEELPIFALIFLTDGRPSDRTPFDERIRTNVLRDMASMLGSKLIFKAIGLGASSHNFSVLADMAEDLRRHGVDASFDFAQQCAAMLSNTLSSVSISMTSARDTMLSCAPKPRVEKKVTMRDRNTPKAERKFVAYTKHVSRWCLNRKKEEGGDDWPWKMHRLLHNEAKGIEIDELPFGRGRERLAYACFEIDVDRKRVGRPLVGKESIATVDQDNALRFYHSFCRDQALADMLAQQFNYRVKECAELKAVEGGSKSPAISFLSCSIYEYTAESGEVEGLLVEAYLKGKFTKYNGNNGYVRQYNTSDRCISLAIGDVRLTDFLHAFSHWSLIESKGERLVCDLQGVLNAEGRNPRFELTDPCICDRHTQRNRRKFKKEKRSTDMGMRGIRNFLRSHKCSKVCQALGLQHSLAAK